MLPENLLLKLSEISSQQLKKLTGTIVGETLNKPEFGWKLSEKPRFLEGARYYLQYAGMPDTLVYSPNAYKNDYNDDYMSRSLWVNYLKGDPYGPAELIKPQQDLDYQSTCRLHSTLMQE